ncbi:MAG TPA: HlyD family efflux transporter periplasmic adaptor subunit [Fimbriiglobus sp.]|jgi:multidrug resistance efflux pump
MFTNPIRDLKECNQFLQTIQSRTPRFVHLGVLLLVGLIATAVTWAGFTRVNLVVTAAGRVRPVSTPQKIGLARADGLLGKVAEVHFYQGQFVREGDLLLRLDTEKLRNDIARKRRVIQGSEEELKKSSRLADLQQRQADAALAKLDAEIAQAREEVKNGKGRQDADRRLIEADLADAVRDEASLERLAKIHAVSPDEVQKATAKRRELEEKLKKNNVPIEEGKVDVLCKARQLAEEDNSIRSQESRIKWSFKKAEVESARIELANLELDLKQAELRAPMSGVVTSPEVKVGEVLEPGRPIAEIAEQRGFRIEFAVGSEEIEKVKPGMPVTIKLEAFDYQKYGTLGGTVDFISPDSTVSEGHAGAVYLVRATVNGDTVGRGQGMGQIKLGMAGQVELVTGEECLLKLLVRKVRHGIRLQ